MGKQGNKRKQGWQAGSGSAASWNSWSYRGYQQQQQQQENPVSDHTLIPYDKVKVDAEKDKTKDPESATLQAGEHTNVGLVQRALNQARKKQFKEDAKKAYLEQQHKYNDDVLVENSLNAIVEAQQKVKEAVTMERVQSMDPSQDAFMNDGSWDELIQNMSGTSYNGHSIVAEELGSTVV